MNGKWIHLPFTIYYSLLTLFAVALPARAAELSVPSTRVGLWQGNVGIVGGIPANYTPCATTACNALNGGNVTIATINAALTSAPDNTIVRIPAGTYNLNGTINISGLNNVILRGAGMNATILNNSTANAAIDSGQTGFLASNRSITSGYTKGSTSIVVGNASGLAAGHLLYVTQRNEPYMRQCQLPSAENLAGQAVRVTAVSGNTVTFTPPLMMDFKSSLSPIYAYADASASRVGIENLTLNATGAPGFVATLWWANEIWFSEVKITGYQDSGILANLSNRIVVRKSYLGFASGHADGYGIQLRNEDNAPVRGTTSNCLIENNVFDGGPQGLMRTGIMNNGGTANVIAYNFITRNSVALDIWQYQGIFSNHKAHGMYNLYEGNQLNAILNDGYHGSTSHDTYFRNHFSGDAPWLTGGAEAGNRIPISLCRWSTYHNVIGNVLGSSRWNPSTYQMTGTPGYYDQPTIYRLGYPNSHNNDTTDGVGCGAPANLDPNVQATLLRHKNYDYFHKTQRLCGSESEGCQSAANVTSGDAIPDSLYLTSKPSWFGTLAWPPVNPATPQVTDIPARVFFNTGSWPDETGVPDTTAPSVPTNPRWSAVHFSSMTLAWNASTDNVGVAGYRLDVSLNSGFSSYISGYQDLDVGNVLTRNVTGLSEGTTYYARVRAYDAAGNVSANSVVVSSFTKRTPPAADATAPTTPGNLTATPASSTQINLSWSASTDNVGVTGYRVERCQGSSCSNFTQIAAPTGTSYSNTGLTASTAYRYRVRAADAAGNVSGYSSIASAVTLAMDTPLIELSKTSTPASAAVGATVTFTIQYRNTGLAAASSVVITDAIPAGSALVPGSITGGGTLSAGTITWTIPSVAAGASGSVSFQVTVVQP